MLRVGNIAVNNEFVTSERNFNAGDLTQSLKNTNYKSLTLLVHKILPNK